MMKRRTNVLLDIGSHVVLVISTIIAIFPLVWILLSSVKGKGELTQFPTRFWPKQFTLDYFTHVINDLHFINNIKKDLCINLQHHGTDVCAELNIDLSNTYLFYCFGSLPTKLQYEKSKGTVNTSLSVIKIKYDKDKINKIYFREFDNSLLLPLNSDKFKLELGYFDIIPLDWY